MNLLLDKYANSLIRYRSYSSEIILFLVFPILSFFVSLNNLKYSKCSLYILGAIFCLFGAYLPPSQDAYRYREMFYGMSDISISLLGENGKDFLLPLLMSFFNCLGFSFETFRFLLMLFCYILWIQIFLESLSRVNVNRNVYFILAVSSVFCIRVFTLAYGMRFGIASVFIVYAYYSFFCVQKRLRAIVFALLAICMHFSMLIMLLLIFPIYLLKSLRFRYSIKLLLILLLIPILSSSLSQAVSLFAHITGNAFVSDYSNTYIEGMWGTEGLLSWLSFNGLIYTFGRIFPLVFVVSFLYKINDNSYFANLFLSVLLLLVLSFSSLTLILRFSNIAIMIGFVLVINNIGLIENLLLKLKLLFLSFVVVFFFFCYAMRDDLVHGRQYYALACPVYALFADFYPDDWVFEHIHSDGIFIDSTMEH